MSSFFEAIVTAPGAGHGRGPASCDSDYGVGGGMTASFVWIGTGIVVVTVGMWWLTRRRTACTCPIPEAITDLRCPVHATPEHRHPDDLPVTDADIAAAVDRLIGDIE